MTLIVLLNLLLSSSYFIKQFVKGRFTCKHLLWSLLDILRVVIYDHCLIFSFYLSDFILFKVTQVLLLNAVLIKYFFIYLLVLFQLRLSRSYLLIFLNINAQILS